MATQSEMLESKYIQKEDLAQPTRIIVAGCTREDIGKENKTDMKWVVSFKGGWKPMILNVTNTKAFFATLGVDSDDWAGKEIILFNDLSVIYEGKEGGIRVYRQMEVAGGSPPQQTTAQPRTDEQGPLPTEPDPTIPF